MTSYSADLTIVDNTQTLTTTATPRSVHQVDGSNQVAKIATDTVTITYATPCNDPTLAAITVTTQSSTTDNSYDGDATWTYTPVTVQGGLCPITLTCESVSGPANVGGFTCPCSSDGCTQAVHGADGSLTSGSFTISRTYDGTAYNAESSTKTPPGDYTYNFKVSTGGVGAELNKDIVVVQKVLDPCLKSKGITIDDVTMNTQEYTIGTTTKTFGFTTGTYDTSTTFCKKTYTISSLPSDINAGTPVLSYSGDTDQFTLTSF